MPMKPPSSSLEMRDPRAREPGRRHEQTSAEQDERRLRVDDPDWIAAKVGERVFPRVVMTKLPVAAASAAIRTCASSPAGTAHRPRARGRPRNATPMRRLRERPATGRTRRTSGARFGLIMIAAPMARPDSSGRSDTTQDERERPRRRGRHVAHRVHDLIEEHRARGDQRRREQREAAARRTAGGPSRYVSQTVSALQIGTTRNAPQ